MFIKFELKIFSLVKFINLKTKQELPIAHKILYNIIYTKIKFAG